MSPGDFIEKIKQYGDADAIISKDHMCTFKELTSRSEEWTARLEETGVPAGAVVSIFGEYGINSISLLLALMKRRSIIVPITYGSAANRDIFHEIAQVEWQIELAQGSYSIEKGKQRATHSIYDGLRGLNHPGLVLFSSGSTGEPKAAVHDLCRILQRYVKSGASFRTLVFLQMDHIGGVNTLFYTLANGGTIIIPRKRSPEDVAAAVEKHRVELLPTSPTFLNLLLLSGAHTRHDMSSLKLVTYGTEPMPEATLAKIAEALPHVRLKQTYGLSEVGIFQSKSMDNKSLWFKIGGDGFETKIVDGRLWVRSDSAMLGYLNAPSPFDVEGYMDTGDLVEQDGDWIRILGRESELINVGGNKVFPAEVENVIGEMDEVEDVLVYGESNPIMGSTVCAIVKLQRNMPLTEFKTLMRVYCKNRLDPYKIPVKVKLSNEPLHSSRFKKKRRLTGK